MCSSCTFTILLATLCISTVSCQHPQNVALLATQSTDFTFVTPVSSFFVLWSSYVSGSKETMYLNGTAGAGAGSRTSVSMSANDTHVVHTLSISNVEESDGGKYGVEDILATPVVEALTEMVVLASDIQCSVSPTPVVAGTDITILCEIPYNGRWAPVITCTPTQVTGGNITVMSFYLPDNSVPSRSQYTYTATVLAGVPRGDVTCETHFESPITEEEAGLASNIPGYTSLWTGSFDVHYPATTIALSSNLTEHDLGDIITCSTSGGNPPAAYTWTNSGTNEVMSTNENLVISIAMVGQNHSVTCTAITTVGGVDYMLEDSTSFYVNEVPTTTTSGTTASTEPPTTTKPHKVDERLVIIIIVATVAALLALVLIIILIVCCVKKGRSSTADLSKGMK